MSSITRSCGPVLWSESELFTLMPSLPTASCVHSLQMILPLAQLPTWGWPRPVLYLAFLYMDLGFCCLYFSTVCVHLHLNISCVCIHIYIYICMHIYIYIYILKVSKSSAEGDEVPCPQRKTASLLKVFATSVSESSLLTFFPSGD